MTKPQAFILFGATTRYTAFLTSIRSHNLTLLVFDEPSKSLQMQFEQYKDDSTHPFSMISELSLVHYLDHTSIMQQVDTWSDVYEIVGVYNIKDVFVEAAGMVADFLGVPTPGLRASIVCRNKHLQRIYLEEWSPSFVSITPDKRSEVLHTFDAFPAVLKPVGRHSKSGIQLITDQAMLAQQLPTYPADEVLLLEAQIHGREFSVETIVQGGQILFENITQKAAIDRSSLYFIEMGHTVPAANLTEQETQTLLAANRAILDRLEVKDGITHGEYRVTDDGEVYLMEIAARSPGGFIKALYYLATGQMLEPELIKVSLGMEASYPKPTRYARQIYISYEPGILEDVVIEGLPDVEAYWAEEKGKRIPPVPGTAGDPPTIRQVTVLKKQGALLNEPKWNDDRVVSVLMDADTPEQLDELEETARRSIRILTKPRQKMGVSK
ncbi:ATP-grasp domain-containing protein [Brevibacillus dissolubilis]|uniref:ATP-grasp domain-containing protein n=1 Tax=Brevibacillus dissolubilis TaxID=1844116 RepID=UPI001115D6E6|nr:ATP-grasp domain-containing protein [Brevibacillus dissolubilis]